MKNQPDEIENSEHHSLSEVLAKLRELAGPDCVGRRRLRRADGEEVSYFTARDINV